jgi:hypothetical protein
MGLDKADQIPDFIFKRGLFVFVLSIGKVDDERRDSHDATLEGVRGQSGRSHG